MGDSQIRNPFVISKSIPESLFCDRKEDTECLIKQVENGRNVVLVSPRRMGKTQLIHHFFLQPAISEHYYTFFVDIYSATSLREMCYLLGRCVYEQLKPKAVQYRESFFQVLKSLRAGFKLDTVTGEPRFELSLGAIDNPETTLEEIFSYLESSPMPCIVAFDEFQQISEFGDRRVEALLRGMIQQCSRTLFIFSGSKQHTISQMFHSKSRPFYQSAQLMDLAPLDAVVYADFAVRLFGQYGKSLDREVVSRVYDEYRGVTWYLQMMMNELFALTAPGAVCTPSLLPTARRNIVDVQEGIYKTQLAMLSPRQKALLQAVANEGEVKSVTSAAFIKAHALESASSVQSALKALVEKEIVSHEETGYRVGDFFFAEWIRTAY